jgi:uracil-DNA glycosylase
LDDEIILIDPELIIPVGRLAISVFYPNKVSLKDIIGTQKQVGGRCIVPLPHPSGASRWHQTEANRDRIGEAVALIRHHVEYILTR